MADAQVAQRFRLALDMYEFGERILRSGLRRRHPEVGDGEIAQMIRDWRETRPGAPGGDAVGRPSRRFD